MGRIVRAADYELPPILEVFTSSGTLTLPDNVKLNQNGDAIGWVTACGGGGGGGGYRVSLGHSGGGGGAGQWVTQYPVVVTSILDTVTAVTIGAAGSQGGDDSDGLAGGVTSLAGVITLIGGRGGFAAAANSNLHYVPGGGGMTPGSGTQAQLSRGGDGGIGGIPGYGRGGCGEDDDGTTGDYTAQAGYFQIHYWLEN